MTGEQTMDGDAYALVGLGISIGAVIASGVGAFGYFRGRLDELTRQVERLSNILADHIQGHPGKGEGR